MMDGEGEVEMTPTPAADGTKTLKDQLDELEIERDNAQKAQIDANIADLTKLIEDADKADDDYAEAYEQLKSDETRLKDERDALLTALEAVLGSDGIQGVEKDVNCGIDAFTKADKALTCAKQALDKAKEDADKAAETLEEKQAILDDWRKPVDSIGKRLKSAQTLIDEIKKLRNANRRGEAYWKLARGEAYSRLAHDHPDTVPGQLFLSTELSREPRVVPKSELRAEIVKAWNEFTGARTTAAEIGLLLDEAKADHKAAETAFKDTSKNLIKAITDALAVPDAPADAA